MMTETQHAETTCRNCDRKLNTAAGNGTPKERDTAVCLYCGEITIYRKDYTLRIPTEEEMVEIKLSAVSSRNRD